MKKIISKKSNLRISIIGLGYVGLPLAIEFSKKFNVIGYDIDSQRINQLNKGFDRTKEIKLNLKKNKIKFTSNASHLKNIDIFIVTVPTPVYSNNKPNLTFLKKATTLIGRYIKDQSIIIYESTVYPGTTEEICVPILKSSTGLSEYQKHSKEKTFGYGYSPERINPGDKNRRINSIVKVTSGNTKEISEWIEEIHHALPRQPRVLIVGRLEGGREECVVRHLPECRDI